MLLALITDSYIPAFFICSTIFSESSTICGCGFPVFPNNLKSKKNLQSVTYPVIHNSVFKHKGNTALACCGVRGLSLKPFLKRLSGFLSSHFPRNAKYKSSVSYIIFINASCCCSVALGNQSGIIYAMSVPYFSLE